MAVPEPSISRCAPTATSLNERSRKYEVALDNASDSPEYDEVHVTVYARSNKEAAEKAFERADVAHPNYTDVGARICGSESA